MEGAAALNLGAMSMPVRTEIRDERKVEAKELPEGQTQENGDEIRHHDLIIDPQLYSSPIRRQEQQKRDLRDVAREHRRARGKQNVGIRGGAGEGGWQPPCTCCCCCPGETTCAVM